MKVKTKSKNLKMLKYHYYYYIFNCRNIILASTFYMEIIKLMSVRKKKIF